jgi:PAS domain S-box-containing protein
MIAGPHFDNYEGGFQFGQLGYALVEKHSLHRYRARTYMAFGSFVMPWTRHVRTGRDLVRRAFDVANRIGDLTFGAYSCNNLNTNLLAAGDALAETQGEAEQGLEFAHKARFGLVIAIITVQLQLIRTLRGLTPAFGCFDDEQFEERRFEHDLASQADLALAECWYWIRKLQARVLAGDYRSAIDASSKARPLLWTSPSFFETAEYEFYSGLCRAALCDCTLADERRNHLEALAAHYRQLEVWAANCPENFENRTALVGAEIARLEGRELDAEHLYEKAIRSADANGFVHNGALANELAARFYAARGFEKIANAYLQEARNGYLRWGANGKVKQLDHLYPHLGEESPAHGSTSTAMAPVEPLAYPHLKNEPDPGPTSTIVASVELLDLATVIKVSQAVSGEMVLEKLMDRLMRAAIEHAGAERGLLIAPRGDTLQMEAEATIGGEGVTVHLRDGTPVPAALPESLVRYVMRTREIVILDDASVQTPFSADPYIVQSRAHSILCLPLVNQTKLIGILYLENNLTPYVFTPGRVTVLKVLASQAAISLENTRLYGDLEDREARIRRLVEANVVGVVMWTLDGAIIEANEAFLHMVQYGHEDLASGRVRWRDLTPAEWRDCDERAVADLKATGAFQPFEKEYFRKNGSRVPVLVAGALFEGSRNEGVAEGVAFVVDLSEQKRAEQERERLRQLEAELAHINRVSTLGEMAASLAHEIKQPIAAAITSANSCMEWLAHEPPNLDRARAAAARIDKYGNRAAEIIDRIRSFYKKSPPQRELVDVNGIVEEMLTLLKGEANRYLVAMRTELAADLPKIMADRVQLQQVFMNLMLNAMEAMKDSGGELTVKSELQDGRLQFSVSDTGVGLPMEKKDQMFSAFFTTKPQGSGMGLAITRSIVESHGGQLWASGNSGGGATFNFTLPIQATESSPLVA